MIENQELIQEISDLRKKVVSLKQLYQQAKDKNKQKVSQEDLELQQKAGKKVSYWWLPIVNW